jgi:ribose 1,5-bisphosphokinase
MNRPATPERHPGCSSARIGPGRLVLVVGPSGAGKDTLLGHARRHCDRNPTIVFPRRVVTRPATEAEDHDSVSMAEFDRRISDGSFALWWSAHGNSYGLPRRMDDDIAAGCTLVCNVSRAVIAQARERYERVTAALVNAPTEVLAERLALRGRETADTIADRLRRTVIFNDETAVDCVIENVGPPEIAAARLVDVIYGRS